MRVMFFYADTPQETNTSMHRAIIPARILSESGRHECHTAYIGEILLDKSPSPETQAFLANCDVVILERLCIGKVHDYLHQWKFDGKRILITFDDNYALMPSSAGSPFQVWRGGKNASFAGNPGAIFNEFRIGLGLVDAIIVPSKVLLEDYRAYAKDAYLVENFLYPPLWQNLPKRTNDRVIAGWGGSSGHYESWLGSNIAPALGVLCRKYPKFHVSIQPHDPRIISLLEKNGVVYEVNNWCDFSTWPSRVAKFDIGLAPLHGEYDRRRSNVKILDYSTAGIPWVSTNSEPYFGCSGGILCDSKSSSWIHALEQLIQSRELRDKMGEIGKEWATKFNSRCVDTYEGVMGI